MCLPSHQENKKIFMTLLLRCRISEMLTFPPYYFQPLMNEYTVINCTAESQRFCVERDMLIKTQNLPRDTTNPLKFGKIPSSSSPKVIISFLFSLPLQITLPSNFICWFLTFWFKYLVQKKKTQNKQQENQHLFGVKLLSKGFWVKQ